MNEPTETAGRDVRRGDMFDGGLSTYRNVSPEEYKALMKTGLVVLDANVLLNLYRYHEYAREEFLRIFAALGDSLWIPHQVMAEFLERRVDVIEELPKYAQSTVSDLQALASKYIERVAEWSNRTGLESNVTEEASDIIRRASMRIEEIIVHGLVDDRLQGAAEDIENDPVIIALDPILRQRVAKPMPFDEITRAKEEARRRITNRRPPGFMDSSKKGGNVEGDYLIWYETLQEARRRHVDVLFVTGDVKKDWWRIERGEARGPHQELVAEMEAEVGTRLYMLRPPSLLKHASALDVTVRSELVNDVERVARQTSPETVYGRDQTTWDELIDVGLDYLIEVATYGDIISYTEFNETLKSRSGFGFDFQLPDERGALGYLLALIVKRTYPETNLMISALVTYRNSNDPGPGFYRLAQELGLLRRGANAQMKSEFWINQVRSLHERYSSSSSSNPALK